jgi:hypothetical protein
MSREHEPSEHISSDFKGLFETGVRTRNGKDRVVTEKVFNERDLQMLLYIQRQIDDIALSPSLKELGEVFPSRKTGKPSSKSVVNHRINKMKDLHLLKPDEYNEDGHLIVTSRTLTLTPRGVLVLKMYTDYKPREEESTESRVSEEQ